VINANLLFWKENLLPVKHKYQQNGLLMNPSDFKNGFIKFNFYFEPYLHYVVNRTKSLQYFKEKFWAQTNFTNRLSVFDLMHQPFQRLMKYKLLLEAVQKKTDDDQQKYDLQEMVNEKVS
ncbi:unnamed protein product, partial [Rotaria sp. Silwood1]